MNKLRNKPKVLDEIEDKLDQYERIIAKQNKVIDYLMKMDESSINIERFKY